MYLGLYFRPLMIDNTIIRGQRPSILDYLDEELTWIRELISEMEKALYEISLNPLVRDWHPGQSCSMKGIRKLFNQLKVPEGHFDTLQENSYSIGLSLRNLRRTLGLLPYE